MRLLPALLVGSALCGALPGCSDPGVSTVTAVSGGCTDLILFNMCGGVTFAATGVNIWYNETGQYGSGTSTCFTDAKRDIHCGPPQYGITYQGASSQVYRIGGRK